jgi:uncharacterized 2Fe-2S/4Fe-4S cluster protein (DUF4445 family)
MNTPSAGIVTLDLQPIGRRLSVPRGAALQDILFAEGVEFACGGHGRCKSCRVKVLSGDVPASPDDTRLLKQEEIASGWRLACRAQAHGDLVLEIGQWEATILADDSEIVITPGEGYGIAIDLGTTTIVAQLIDLRTGYVVGVQTALNTQARHGADIMSRVEFAVRDSEQSLTRLIRTQLGSMVRELTRDHPGAAPTLNRVVIVGNSVMHHLFCGISVEPLSRVPFELESSDANTFSASELRWDVPAQVAVVFLPCLGGFVGSDILAGVLATRLHESDELAVLIDLGTNGEMVVGNRHRLLCASTAAGPAFEGARISAGMRAATGAIAEISWQDGRSNCRVLGGVEARGICGSGLVDAVAVGLDRGAIQATGRVTDPTALALAPKVSLMQADVRELQLAKGAIAAGVRILSKRWGATPRDVQRVYLAGAFGNYINRRSAWRIGLIDFPPERVQPSGNTALLGAKIALFNQQVEWRELRQRIEHVPLADEPAFQDVFVEEMAFPPARENGGSSPL